jgi:tetratricopeptide (TPR) repeat protein/transglutaminase-like putative cysteine protease
MKLKCVRLTLLLIVLGCQTQVRRIIAPKIASCTATNASDALSYAYESCLRRQLTDMTRPQIRQAHNHLPVTVRRYLSGRIHSILGTMSAVDNCEDTLPGPYCKLLVARRHEQLGAVSQAHIVYRGLDSSGELPNVSLAGLLRTEAVPDTVIPTTAHKHPDYRAAMCAQMVKLAPNQVFTSVAKECLEKTSSASIVVSELAAREMAFKLESRAIRRLENHLQTDPFNHRIRSQLAQYLFRQQAYLSAIDHIERLIKYQSATPHQLQNLVYALIRTKNYGQATRQLEAFNVVLNPKVRQALSIHLAAHQGQCKALIASSLKAGSSAQNLDATLQRLALISATPCEFVTEGILIDILRLHPDNPKAWSRLIDYYASTGQHPLATKTLNEIMPRFPKSPELYHLAALSHRSKGRLQLALDQIQRARRLDTENLEYRSFETELTFRMSKLPQAVQMMTTLHHIAPADLGVAKKLALAKLLMNDLEQAMVLLKWLSELEPEDEVLKLQYATTLVRLNQPIAAKKALLEAIKTKSTYSDAWALLAITHAGLDEIPEANHAFKRALALGPSHRPLRVAYARFLEDQQELTKAHAQYERLLARAPKDEEAARSLARLTSKDAPDVSTYNRGLRMLKNLNQAHVPLLEGLNAHAIVINDQRDVEVGADGDLTVDIWRTILIKHEAAISKFSKVDIPYDTSVPPEILEAVVISPEGVTHTIGSQHWSHTNPNRGTPMFGDARTLSLNFPGLESGSILRYHVRTRLPNKPSSLVWWDSYVLGNEVFTLSAEYSIRIDPAQDYTVTGVGLTELPPVHKSGLVLRRWTAELVPSFTVLSRTEQALPMIYLSSFEKWKDVDDWYTDLFTPATVLGPTLKAVAKEISTQHSTKSARIAAVLEAVEHRITYEGVEFGVGAYLPRPAESSWLRRKGDCKDMVALIVGLLNHMHIEAHPVLIRPKDAGPFMVHYPSPSQFSHVIVRIKDEHQKDLWADPTARMGTVGALPALVRGASALIVNGKGGVITQTPSSIDFRNTVHQTSTINVADTALAHINSTLSLRGDAAGWARIYIRNQTELNRHHHLYLPGLMLGNRVIPSALRIPTLAQSNEPLNIETEGLIDIPVGRGPQRTFKGVLDPTDSSFIALLNGAEQVNAPQHFRKTTIIKFERPHRLETKVARLKLNGPIQLTVSRTGSWLEHHIEVTLNIDHTQILNLNEREFMESLRRAQAIMEQALIFVPKTLN